MQHYLVINMDPHDAVVMATYFNSVVTGVSDWFSDKKRINVTTLHQQLLRHVALYASMVPPETHHHHHHIIIIIIIIIWSLTVLMFSSGRMFQTRGPATVKILLPTVESLMAGTSRLLELAEHNVCRPGWSATRVLSTMERYDVLSPWKLTFFDSLNCFLASLTTHLDIQINTARLCKVLVQWTKNDLGRNLVSL